MGAIFAIGICCVLGYVAFLGVLAFVAAFAAASTAVIHAISLSLSGNPLLLGLGEDAIYGLVSGLIIGLVRVLFRIRWRMTESLIGAVFSSRLFEILRSTPGAWSLIFFTVAISTLVGYGVGIFMESVGAPPFFDSDFTGPVAMLLSSAAGGSGGGVGGGADELLVAFCIVLILILACLVLAIVIALVADIIFAVAIVAFDGSIEGATEALGTASVERLLLSDASRRPKRPLTLLCKDGAITGSISSLITSFIFAVNGVATHQAEDGGGIHRVAISVSVWIWTKTLVPLGTLLGNLLYYFSGPLLVYVIIPIVGAILGAIVKAWRAHHPSSDPPNQAS